MPSRIPRGRRGSRSARARLSRAVALLGALLALPIGIAALAPAAGAQGAGNPLVRAEDLEGRERYDSAAAAYREALAQTPASVPAILGLERVYAEMGRSDSLLPVLDRAISLSPRTAALREAQLRTLHSLGDEARVRAAFDAWRRDVPHDPAPYRAYARMLIDDGRSAQADTVLRMAQSDAGGARGFDYELAQLHASMGMWEASARSWRGALAANPYLDQAAIYSLVRTAAAKRDLVRRALLTPPTAPATLQVLAALELAWGDPRAAWEAVSGLRPDSAGVSAWLDFASRAEQAGAWLAARDALAAAGAARPSPELASRAAADALTGGDASSAATLATAAERALDSTRAAIGVVPVHLHALASLGRPQDAERLLAAYAPHLKGDDLARDRRLIAWAWVRTGQLDRAKAALASAGGSADDPAQGWISLYEGDLAAARKTLRATPDATPDQLEALALLQRTTTDRAPAVGRAYLALARGDTAAAAAAFDSAAADVPDAASLLLVHAARLYAARGDLRHAVPLWARVSEQMSGTPEAPEAELAWARALRGSGDTAGAVARLEHLILAHPESALVPQARRELELARRAVPSTQ